MKLRTPLDRARITGHFQYNAWKYVLIALMSVFLWDLVYSFTAYRPSQDKRIDIYTQHAYGDQDMMQTYLDELRDDVTPGVELVTIATLLGSSETDMFAAQQLTTYIAAQEGDLYFLSGADFKRFASQGVFLELEPFIKNGILNLDGIDLSSGYIAMQEFEDETQSMRTISQRKLFGIPAATLTGFAKRLGIDHRDLFLGVTFYNGNEEQVFIYLNELIQRMRPQAQEEPSP